MIKVVFLDFDGTLFSHKTHEIPSSAIEAINKARANGIKVFLCTGRARSEFDQFDLSMLNVDGMVLCNGQICFDEKDNIIYDNPIEGKLKESLIDIFVNKKLPIYFSNNENLYLNFENEHIRNVQAAVTSDVPEIKEYHGERIYMASIFYENDEELNYLKSRCENAQITCWHEGAVDVVPEGACKSKGIKEIIRYYNIDISETMAIGDGDNDMDMLKECGVGVAMGNSPLFVKEVADYITDDIDENGIYNAFKYYELI